MKKNILILIFIVFVGCSTESNIIGTWDFSYSTDDYKILNTITFSDEDKTFSVTGEIRDKYGYKCFYSASGNFLVSKKDVLSFKYNQIATYNCSGNSNLRIFLKNMEGQTFSQKIKSVESDIFLVNDDNYYDITYIRNKDLEMQKDDNEMDIYLRLTRDLPCYESSKLKPYKKDSNKVNALIRKELKWSTIFFYKNDTLTAEVYHRDVSDLVATTTDVGCYKKTISTNSYISYGDVYIGFSPEIFEKLRKIHNKDKY